MSGLLVSRFQLDQLEDRLQGIEAETGVAFERVLVPDDPDGRVDPAVLARVEIAFFSYDVFPDRSRAFFAAALGASGLRWLHNFNTGTDHPIFERFLERGVELTNSPRANAPPIAQTAITGMLMLARGFPHWLDAQRRCEWERIPAGQLPSNLSEQTLVIVGLGAIGSEIARLGRAFGLEVIGVRRSPRTSGDPVDELISPGRLKEVLPRADWLALACPLTEATRGLIDAEALAALPRGARLLNVARGEIIDEAELIEALRTGQVGGAYLDVFETEPLASDSPLWRLPNVIVTPHNSAVSTGSGERQARGFLRNLAHWARKQPLEDRVGQ